MSLLELVVALLVVAVVAALVIALVGRGDGGGSRVAAVLRIVAVVATAVTAGVVGWWAWQEGTGAFTLALVGVPLAAALLVLGSTLAGRPSRVVTWVAAVVLLAWGLLAALGPGLFFLGPAALMVVAAVASTGDRTRSRAAISRKTP